MMRSRRWHLDALAMTVVFSLVAVAQPASPAGQSYPSLVPRARKVQAYINGIADRGGAGSARQQLEILPLLQDLESAQHALPPNVPRPTQCYDMLMGAWSLAQQGQRQQTHEASQRAVDCYAYGPGYVPPRPAPTALPNGKTPTASGSTKCASKL